MSRTRFLLTSQSTTTSNVHRTFTGHEDASVVTSAIDEELLERAKKLANGNSSKEIAALYEDLEQQLLNHMFLSTQTYNEAVYYLSLALSKLATKNRTMPRLDALSKAHVWMSSPYLRDCVAVTVSSKLALLPSSEDALTLQANDPFLKALKNTALFEKLPPSQLYASVTIRFDRRDTPSNDPAYHCTPHKPDGSELPHFAFSISREQHPQPYQLAAQLLPPLPSRYDYYTSVHQSMRPGSNRYALALNLARILTKLPPIEIPSRHPYLHAVRAEMLAPRPPDDHPKSRACARSMSKLLDRAMRKANASHS